MYVLAGNPVRINGLLMSPDLKKGFLGSKSSSLKEEKPICQVGVVAEAAIRG